MNNLTIAELLTRAISSSEFVAGLINCIEQFDEYERKKAEKDSDKQLLESALCLYKQGKISRVQFLTICETLTESEVNKHGDVNLLMDKIRQT